MPMEGDEGRAQTQSSPSGMGAGRAAERGDTTGYQGQGRGSGVTSDRPSPGGGNTGGGGGGNKDNNAAKEAADREKAQQKARAESAARESAAREAANRAAKEAADRAAAETAAREFQKRQMAEAEKARLDSVARQEAAKNLGIPSLMVGSGVMSPPLPQVAPITTMDFGPTNKILTSAQGGQYDPTTGGMIPNADMLKGYIKLSGATGDQTTTRNSMLEGFSKDYLTKMFDSLAKTPGDVSIGSARRSPEEQASIISDRLRAIDPKVAMDWDKSVSEKGAIAAGQEFKDLFDIAGYFKAPGTQVAMPGSSQHQKSSAMDIAFGGEGAAREDLINRFQTTAMGSGLSFPVKGEYWHAELAGDRPTQVATSPFVRDLNKTFAAIGTGVKTVADATGVSSVADFFTNKSLMDEIVRENNRDRQMTQEEINIAMFNRLHPEAGSDRERYGGRDQVLPTAPITPSIPKTPVVPPVVPTEPVMPTVPNFAAAQQYIGTPTVATPGFNFSMPFAPRPPIDFANLGQAYAPTALPSAPPTQPLPGIPGAMYVTPYQRLG